ncbi:hypothetical protein FRC00_012568 [Tulasnella sp. 408]|nr:hypothetical protein FRC00_012568 [Tulasnella sp. 408]
MGVITYFLLCGYTPFDRDTQQQEMEAIIRGDYKFEPAEYWNPVSETARDFVRSCLTIDPRKRPTAADCLKHPWLAETKKQGVPDPTTATGQADLLPTFQKAFNAKKTFRKAVLGVMASRRMATTFGANKEKAALPFDLDALKKNAESEQIDEKRTVTYAHMDDPSSPRNPLDELKSKPLTSPGRAPAS